MHTIMPRLGFKSFHRHLLASEYQDLLGKEKFDKTYKFGFVRNPWDWQVSIYHFTLQTPRHFQHQIIKDLGSFKEYIYWRRDNEYKLQSDFFEIEGKNVMNFIGKLENIDQDFEIISQKIGLKAELPKLRTAQRSNYQDYYDRDTKNIVESIFAKDIENFSYEY